jgi:predicted regulator of Ras-like GTPase activity (Roadblock/LC7/MglB family)
MDPRQALADLTEISSQIETAVLFDAAGTVHAATVADEGRAQELARAAGSLLAAAEEVRGSRDEPLTQLEAATRDGSVFVVRDGERLIVATTPPEPTVGLVFYDLKSTLREVATKPAPRKRAPARRKPAQKKSDAKP